MTAGAAWIFLGCPGGLQHHPFPGSFQASERGTPVQEQAPTPAFGELLKAADSLQNPSALISWFGGESSNPALPLPLMAKALVPTFC